MVQLNNHVRREYYIVKVLAICFTFLFFIVCGILFLAEQKIISDVIVIVASLLCYLLPFVILISWHMCVERYIHLKLMHCETQDSERMHKQVKAYVRNIIFSGIIFGICALANVYFMVNYWKYIGEIYFYYIIVLIVTVGWLLNFGISIIKADRTKPNSKRTKLRKTLVKISFIIVSIGCLGYAMIEASTFAFLKKVL